MIVIVGPKDVTFAHNVLAEYPTAQLCTDLNFNDTNEIVYTSINDLSLYNFIKLLDRADEIIYKHNGLTQDERMLVEAWILYNSRTKKVTGTFLDNSDFLKLADCRKTDSNQIWIAGCSISEGVGIDRSDRWGQLLANQLSMPVSFLTERGTSIEWAADQILRSDIRKDDLVAWGITSTSRYMHYSDNGTRCNIMANRLSGQSPLALIEKNLAFKSIHYIHQVINFLTKQECKFRFILMFPPQSTHSFVLNHLLANDNIIVGFNSGNEFSFADYGTDGTHPGPEQHKIYASKVISSL